MVDRGLTVRRERLLKNTLGKRISKFKVIRLVLISLVASVFIIYSRAKNASSQELIPEWKSNNHAPFILVEAPYITNPVITASNVTDVSASFVADPFLFYENDQWYMFFEVFNETSGRGEIGLATSSDGLHWNYDQIILSEEIHLSYPFVFKHNDEYYLIPETYMANEVRLYRATAFPYNWTYVSTLLTGRGFVDPSLFYYNNMWWMFVGGPGHSSCYLFYSDSLTTGWTEHPMSPIVSNDKSKARPGGRSFVFDNDRVMRIAQKDDVVYGEQVRVFEVDILTETDYVEHEIPESPILTQSGTGWNATGMHHFDPWWNGVHWLCAADGNRNGVWSIGLYIAPLFVDVLPGNWAENYIYAIFNAVITTGCAQNPLRYCPQDPVNRAQVAAFIVRALEGEPPDDYCDTGSPFTDIDPNFPMCKYIKRLSELEITTGYTDGTYRPTLFVNRAQMAAFLARAFLGMN